MCSRNKRRKTKEKTLSGKKAKLVQKVFDRVDMVRDVR
jgi:hypothetical protein